MKMFQSLIDSPKRDSLLIMVPTWYPLMPPLGLSYVASYLRFKGYNPQLYDFNAKLYNSVTDEDRKLWDISIISSLPFQEIVKIIKDRFSKQIDELVEVISQRPEPIIGFSVTYLSVQIAAYIAEKIKEKQKNKLIVFGGPGCFWEYDRVTIKPSIVDIFVIGEGEIPFYEVVDNFYKGIDVRKVSGTVFYRNGKMLGNPYQRPVLNLDEIPFPTFQDLDLLDYNFGKKESRTLPILMSRGCISKCTFCVDHIMCNPFRMRTPESVINEIQYHINVTGVNNFSFNDLMCNGDLKKLEGFCTLLKEKNISIKWGSYAMVKGDMSLELFKKIKDSGCTILCYGIESGSDRILKTMGKLYNVSDAERVLRLTHEAGIKSTLNIIIGYPQEGRREFRETLAFLKRNKNYIDGIINVSTLFINPTAKIGCKPWEFNLYFPKHPNSFRALMWKKIFLPKYYKLFGASVSVLNLQGIDISNFVDNRGNIRSQRIRRLTKALRFINRLGLFKDEPIVNVYATENKTLKKAIQEVKNRCSISSRDILTKCSYLGFSTIAYKDKIITQGPGLNVAFRFAEDWYDTSRYFWDISKPKANVLKVSIFMKDVGTKQVWLLKFYKNRLLWKISGDWEKSNIIPDEIKIGLQLETNYKYWFSESYGGEFPPLNENWRSLEFKDVKRATIFAANNDSFCDISVEKIKSSKPFFLRFENSPKEYSFRFLAFRGSDFKKNKNKTFNISTAIDFKNVKSKIIENIRENKLPKEIKDFYPASRWPVHTLDVDKMLFKHNNVLGLQLQKGVRLFFGNKELTSAGVGAVSLRTNSDIFSTEEASWSIVDRGKNIRCNISWKNISIKIRWSMKIKNNNVLWSLKISPLNKLKLKEVKLTIPLQADYVNWSASNIRGYLMNPDIECRRPVSLEKYNVKRLFLSTQNSGLPELECLKSDIGFFELTPQTKAKDIILLSAVISERDILKKRSLELKFVLRFKR